MMDRQLFRTQRFTSPIPSSLSGFGDVASFGKSDNRVYDAMAPTIGYGCGGPMKKASKPNLPFFNELVGLSKTNSITKQG